jgi:hypothetical protein
MIAGGRRARWLALAFVSFAWTPLAALPLLAAEAPLSPAPASAPTSTSPPDSGRPAAPPAAPAKPASETAPPATPAAGPVKPEAAAPIPSPAGVKNPPAVPPAAPSPPLPPAAEPTPPPAKAAADTAPPQQPNNLEPLDPKEATGVLGKKVQGSKGEAMGLIVDVIVDAVGAPRAAIIDFGGFLGVGSRKIAIDWRLLQFKPGADEPVSLILDRAHVQAAPEYKPAGPGAQMVGPSPVAPAPPDAAKK